MAAIAHDLLRRYFNHMYPAPGFKEFQMKIISKYHCISGTIAIIFCLLYACVKDDLGEPMINEPSSFAVPKANAGADELHKYAATRLDRGNYEEALHYYTKAYGKAKEDKNEELLAKILNNTGLIYWKLNDTKTALESYTESGRLAEKLNMSHLLALTYTNRALIHKDEEAFRTAKELNTKAIQILTSLNYPKDLAIAYNNHGQIFKFQSEMDSAKIYYLKAAAIYDTIDYKDGKSATYRNLADVYSSDVYRDKEKALHFARSSLELGLESESKVRISEGYQKMFEVYKKFNILDSALTYHQKYADYRQEIFDTNMSEKLIEYQSKLGNELQKLRIENLEKEKELTKSRIWIVLVSIFTGILCMGFFVYRRFARVKVTKKRLETELTHSRAILDVKEKALISYILDVSNKNNQINELQNQLSKEFASHEDRIGELIQQKILTDEDWASFKAKFSQIYPGFLTKIKSCNVGITEAEIRYLVLSYLKLSPKEMSRVLGVSDTTIHKYKMRLKKKLQQEGFLSVEEFMRQL